MSVGHRLSAGRGDLVDHQLRGIVSRIGSCTVAGHRSAEVVHHHSGAPRRQQQCVLPAQSPARTGDDGDLPVEAKLIHNGQLSGAGV